MNNTPNLGQLISITEAQRDAIHIAVAPVIAAHILVPGRHVGFVEEGNTEKVGIVDESIGIVDPFLMMSVQPGQRFWLFLYPNTVTGLRHDWTHPAFASAPTAKTQEQEDIITKRKQKAKEWLEAFCHRYNPPAQNPYCKYFSPDELIQAATEAVESKGFRIHCYDNERLQDGLFNHSKEFWENWSIVTGIFIPKEIKNIHYTCSC